MSVNRNNPNSKASVQADNFGWLVRYTDYQKLEAENKTLKERLANLNLFKFEVGDDCCYDVPRAAVDNWEIMKKDYAFLYKKFKALCLVEFVKIADIQKTNEIPRKEKETE